jgi:S1-C subfamily serine protease
MTRRISWIALLPAFSLVAFAWAGEKKHCTMPTGECVKAMHEKLANAGWLGIETEKNDKGVVLVQAVVPGSPAAAAGFRQGDALLAINGIEINEENSWALKKAKKSMHAGSEASYTVLRQGAKKTLSAKLVAPPRKVVAQWIGEHVIAEHLGTQVATK